MTKIKDIKLESTEIGRAVEIKERNRVQDDCEDVEKLLYVAKLVKLLFTFLFIA